MTESGTGPDPIIDTPRLSLMAVLAGAREQSLAAARDASGLTDPVASEQVVALEAAGYLTSRTRRLGRRPRVWLSLTPAGREALRRHIAALRQIADS